MGKIDMMGLPSNFTGIPIKLTATSRQSQWMATSDLIEFKLNSDIFLMAKTILDGSLVELRLTSARDH